MKTAREFLEDVSRFKYSEFLHRLDTRQLMDLAKEAMELYSEYKNKELLNTVKTQEMCIVGLRIELKKSLPSCDCKQDEYCLICADSKNLTIPCVND